MRSQRSLPPISPATLAHKLLLFVIVTMHTSSMCQQCIVSTECTCALVCITDVLQCVLMNTFHMSFECVGTIELLVTFGTLLCTIACAMTISCVKEQRTVIPACLCCLLGVYSCIYRNVAAHVAHVCVRVLCAAATCRCNRVRSTNRR
jgi:hypothetical protein